MRERRREEEEDQEEEEEVVVVVVVVSSLCGCNLSWKDEIMEMPQVCGWKVGCFDKSDGA